MAPISSTGTVGFEAIKHAVARVFGAPTTVMIMVGNTDTRHYWEISKQIYRFSAIEIELEDVGMFHGVNERVSCANLLKLTLFYEDVLARTVLMDDDDPEQEQAASRVRSSL